MKKIMVLKSEAREKAFSMNKMRGFRGGIHFCLLRRYTWRQEIKNFINYAISEEKKMSIYNWHGSWARWEIREMEELIKACKEGRRTEEEVWKRFCEIVRGEKHR